MMATFEEQACSNCNYWWNNECRRHAPRSDSAEDPYEPSAYWPATDADDWCGEWMHVVEQA